VISRAGEPAVSVVIPTYNAHRYLVEALEHLREQTIEPAEVEVIVVDDGSDDDTWAYLEEQLAGWPELVIQRQDNTGRPGAVRNVGLTLATGRYVFFHDADDWLAAHALQRLVEAADEYGADIVIGRVRTVGDGVDRHSKIKPSTDADLIKDGIWSSLAPVKLFRRRLLDDHRLSFPDDQPQGEDQVFVAGALFAAARVVTLTDDDYYFRRRRADGGNLSSKAQTFDNKVLTTSRVARLITDNVPPEARSPYFHRILLRTLAPGLGTPFMNAGPAEREEGLARLQRDVLPHLDERLIDKATDLARLRLSVAATGSVDELERLNRWIATERSMAVEDGALVFDLPPELDRLLPNALRRVTDPVQGLHRALDLHRDGKELSLSLTIDRTLRQIRPDRAVLELTRRGGPEFALIEGRIDSAGDRVHFTLRPLAVARSVPGPAIWNVSCAAYRSGVQLSSARIAWSDEFETGSLSWKAWSGSTTAALERTKRDNVRLDTTSPTGGLGRRLRAAADRRRGR
jgi:hypothetical protein